MENRGMGGFEGPGDWTSGTAPGVVGGQGEEAREKAQALGDSARRQATRRLDARKGQVSGLLDRLAETLEGDELGGYAAGYVRRGAEVLRGRSADELIAAAGDGLRSRPAAVVGLAFLAGFAFARFARR
jgi:hypothetical protein